jgi:hypothetical protein
MTKKWPCFETCTTFLQPVKLSCVVTFCFFLSYDENVVIFSFFWCGFRTNIEKYHKLIANGREIAPKKHVKKCNIL